MATPLGVDELYWRCDPAQFEFETTAELPDLDQVIGQPRVVSAIRFAADMDYTGYNIFALGPPGLGKHSAAQKFLAERAKDRPVPLDWCYVTNFDDVHKPRRLSLPAGRGARLRHDMASFVEDCRLGLQSAFESEEYRTRRQIIEEEMKERNEAALAEVEKEATAHNIAMIRTPMGFALAAVRNGEIIKPETFQRFPASEREPIEADMEQIQAKLREALRQAPKWFKETRDRIRKLNEDTAHFAVMDLLEALKRKYADLADVIAYLEAVGADVVAHAEDFLVSTDDQPQQMKSSIDDGQGLFRRYYVNLLVDHSQSQTAPVVYEDNPTYDRLLGSIEHRAEMGALTTDFSLIHAGALHRANGGYLILDARKVLGNMLAWEGLKQTLRSREIRIEPLAHALSLLSTQTLEPEPIPLDVKVVLVGERLLYYLLAQYDPEFGELFKVAADFDERIDRSPDTLRQYAQLVGSVIAREALHPFDRTAVARVMEHSTRLASHQGKLSANITDLADLLREADHRTRVDGHETVTAVDVDYAIDAQTYRSDRISERIQDEILDGTILIETDGEKVAQINGLSVMTLGGFSFGKPSKITARIRLGRGDVIDIEREVALGGPLHSKGVLILAGYLSSHYAGDRPLSLNASLVFEQSYGGVDGDSASSAELYCLLSAIADVPITQRFAVTGSVNQAGEVQAIGGVNDKIEGFFDVCAARRLTGDQGVLIPHSNVKHLMLHRRVRDAIEAGQFHVYPVQTIDQGIEILTGMTAGDRQADGAFPDDSFNRRVADRLREFAEIRAKFGRDRHDDNQEAAQ
ncbi:MAG: AAA family ATPase [Alphaproteobacteria bacterium]|nr:AAA family ATPase [Alphaproteobacteria bacterium]